MYSILYADPPWEYKSKKTGGSMKSGAAQKYKTMSMDELKALPIKQIAEKDSVLFLWATVPLLPEALDLMKAWGYKYKTMLTWRKIMSQGLGYWFRGQTEHLLFGTKGKVKAFRYQKSNFHECKVGKHSAKPDYFRDLISAAVEKTMPDACKLEMFARGEADPGWDVYGDQVGNSISLK